MCNITMQEIANTLDCMHDQQFVVGKTMENISGGIAAALDASYYKGTGSRNGKEREFVAVEVKEGGERNAAARNSILQILWETYGEKAVQQWGIGMLELLQQEGLLRERVHENSVQVQTENWNELEHYSQICASEEGKRLLRNLRESGKNGRTPYRPQSTKQQFGEPSKALPELSHSNAQEAERLLNMWETNKGIGLLQQALHSFQEVRRSVCNKVPKVPRRTQNRKYIVRRLTPLETLRLQGLPDYWVDGANGSDSAIYKMAGNGLAIPCAEDVLRRIAEELRRPGGKELEEKDENAGRDTPYNAPDIN